MEGRVYTYKHGQEQTVRHGVNMLHDFKRATKKSEACFLELPGIPLVPERMSGLDGFSG